MYACLEEANVEKWDGSEWKPTYGPRGIVLGITIADDILPVGAGENMVLGIRDNESDHFTELNRDKLIESGRVYRILTKGG